MSGTPTTARRCTCAVSPRRCGNWRGIAAAAGWPRAAATDRGVGLLGQGTGGPHAAVARMAHGPGQRAALSTGGRLARLGRARRQHRGLVADAAAKSDQPRKNFERRDARGLVAGRKAAGARRAKRARCRCWPWSKIVAARPKKSTGARACAGYLGITIRLPGKTDSTPRGATPTLLGNSWGDQAYVNRHSCRPCHGLLEGNFPFSTGDAINIYKADFILRIKFVYFIIN